MLYVVTTNWFENDSQTLGVFTEKELAYKAIIHFIHEYLGEDTEIESDDYLGVYYAVDTNVEFMIDECYPNVPLA